LRPQKRQLLDRELEYEILGKALAVAANLFVEALVLTP